MLASVAWCEPLDEAVRALAKKLSAHLAPTETAQVSLRNLTTMASGDAANAKAILERSLRRAAPRTVEVRLTISQSLQDTVLVAEFDRSGQHVVEMVRYRPDASAPVPSVSLEKRLLCEQAEPILDVVARDDGMLILQPRQIVLYEPSGRYWRRAGTKPLEGAPVLRDPRGRLEVSNGSLTAYLPGVTCKATANPISDIRCEASAAVFDIDGESVRWMAGGNTLEGAMWQPLFAIARVSVDATPLYLAAEVDGRTHLYDGSKAPTGTIDGWGSDLVSAAADCQPGKILLVSGAGDGDVPDTLSAYRFEGFKAVQSGDPLNFSGPLTALWPAANGAVAVSRDLASGVYAAYNIAVTCSR